MAGIFDVAYLSTSPFVNCIMQITEYTIDMWVTKSLSICVQQVFKPVRVGGALLMQPDFEVAAPTCAACRLRSPETFYDLLNSLS